MEVAQLCQSESALQKIGFGNCGSVWADTSEDADQQLAALVIKREDGGKGRSLAKEHRMHARILSTLQTYELPSSFSSTPTTTNSNDQSAAGHKQYRVNIPHSIAFIESRASSWPSLLRRFPDGHTACKALVSERIMPVRRATRQLLAHKYWEDGAAEKFADTKANEHCLIRLYLGRRRHHRDGPRRLKVYSLQNFPLHLDQARELDLPLHQYAMAMADTLAFLYWAAKLDANDVEFVLARDRDCPADGSTPSPGIGSETFSSTRLGPHAMWLLDFDCCNELEWTEDGIEDAVRAFRRNDPYFPGLGGGIKTMYSCGKPSKDGSSTRAV